MGAGDERTPDDTPRGRKVNKLMLDFFRVVRRQSEFNDRFHMIAHEVVNRVD